MPKDLKIISDFYDFMLWTIRHTEKFPRHHRYSLGIAIENRLQTILSMLLRARFSKDRNTWLFDANIELDVLRFQIRLAKDVKVLPVKSHGFAAKSLDSIGSQIGGWIKSKSAKHEALR